MSDNKSKAPSTSEQFNKVYRTPIASWVWGDVRIPKELNDLVKANNPKTSLELGCGLGRFSRFMVKQGIKATGVDFSTVAIEKAKEKVANDESKPIFINPDFIAKIFGNGFQLVNSKFSRRRLIASHWYWLVREN